MKCKWNYLTADGRRLRCTCTHDSEDMRWDLEDPDGNEYGQHNNCTVSWGGASMTHDGMTWREDDFCAWRDGDGSLLDLAHDLMEPRHVVSWLHHPNDALEGRVPLDDHEGAKVVLHALATGAYL